MCILEQLENGDLVIQNIPGLRRDLLSRPKEAMDGFFFNVGGFTEITSLQGVSPIKNT
jgi:hypothetical protein